MFEVNQNKKFILHRDLVQKYTYVRITCITKKRRLTSVYPNCVQSILIVFSVH